MSNPRRQRALLALGVVTADRDVLSSTATTGETWPDSGSFQVRVPEWATAVAVVATWGQVLYPGGNAWGYLWAKIGSGRADAVTTQHTAFDTLNTAGGSRNTIQVADWKKIPASLRGDVVTVSMGGRLTSGPASSAPIADGYSSLSLDLEWLEEPVEED
jgi:hypothetical protein